MSLTPEQMVETIMLQDQLIAHLKQEKEAWHGVLDKSRALAECHQKRATFWRKQHGFVCFALCAMALATLTLWMVVNEKSRKLEQAQQTCEVVAQDPNVLELPPMYIEGRPAAPAVEL